MKRILLLLVLMLLAGCARKEPEQTLPSAKVIETVPESAVVPTMAPETTEVPATVPETTEVPATVPETTIIPTTIPETVVPETTEATLPPVVLDLTEEEQQMLLKIGMAELGHTKCETCIALVMRTVINRVESGRFSQTIRGVLFAQDQFTPVMDGSYQWAEPNEACFAALDQVMRGWDESQGALYYEFCEGESWHSRNLTLVTSHCNTRFYQ